MDIHYLDHGLGVGEVYCISVIDDFSRAALSSLLARSQDLGPVLLLLYSAMRRWGLPEALVTDSGGVFLANHAQHIYAALGIRKEEIARRQAWQNLPEAEFGTQTRMADYAFAQASTWDELLRYQRQGQAWPGVQSNAPTNRPVPGDRTWTAFPLTPPRRCPSVMGKPWPQGYRPS